MAVTAHRDASERIALLRYRRQQSGDILDQLQKSAISMLSGLHIGIQLRRSGSTVRLSRDVGDAFLAIGKEAIANILRHSQAREMLLSLRFGKRGVEFDIEDDGVGFDCATMQAGVGQKGMKLRARQVGATWRIVSSPGSGCRVVVYAPYRGLSRILSWCRRMGKSSDTTCV